MKTIKKIIMITIIAAGLLSLFVPVNLGRTSYTTKNIKAVHINSIELMSIEGEIITVNKGKVNFFLCGEKPEFKFHVMDSKNILGFHFYKAMNYTNL